MKDNNFKKTNILSTPKPIKWTVQGLYILVILHLVIPIIMRIKQQSLVADSLKLNSQLSPAEVTAIVHITIISAAIFHIVFVILYIWLSVMIYKRKNWVRVVLTGVLFVGTLASVVSFMTSTMFRAIIPVTDLIQLVLILLLWIPMSSRDYFAKGKS